MIEQCTWNMLDFFYLNDVGTFGVFAPVDTYGEFYTCRHKFTPVGTNLLL